MSEKKKLSFEQKAKRNIITFYEKKYPEAIAKAEEMILKSTEKGQYVVNIRDANLPFYFACKYGFKAQGLLVIVC